MKNAPAMKQHGPSTRADRLAAQLRRGDADDHQARERFARVAPPDQALEMSRVIGERHGDNAAGAADVTHGIDSSSVTANAAASATPTQRNGSPSAAAEPSAATISRGKNAVAPVDRRSAGTIGRGKRAPEHPKCPRDRPREARPPNCARSTPADPSAAAEADGRHEAVEHQAADGGAPAHLRPHDARQHRHELPQIVAVRTRGFRQIAEHMLGADGGSSASPAIPIVEKERRSWPPTLPHGLPAPARRARRPPQMPSTVSHTRLDAAPIRGARARPPTAGGSGAWIGRRVPGSGRTATT